MKLNKVMIIGNLGRDPQETRLPSGTIGSKFPVAVNDTWTDSNGNRHTDTTWFLVRVSNNQADACNKFLFKGRKVYVEGKLRANEFGNPLIWFKNDDVDRRTPYTSFELLAWTVEFGENPNRDVHVIPDDDDYSNQTESAASDVEPANVEVEPEEEEEFPF